MKLNLRDYALPKIGSSGLSIAVLALLICRPSLPLLAQKPHIITEEIEWTWEVRPQQTNPNLPNVLLLGDSISRAYYPDVTKDLEGVANVYLMASSTSVGDPRIEHQILEFSAAEGVRFDVIHFNNGMHGWGYTEDEYKSEFPKYLRVVRKLLGRTGALIWATTTPVRSDADNGATLPRIEKRNRIALSIVKPAGVSIDDQFALMESHQGLHQDPVHFNSAGAKIQADQVSAIVVSALKSTAVR